MPPGPLVCEKSSTWLLLGAYDIQIIAIKVQGRSKTVYELIHDPLTFKEVLVLIEDMSDQCQNQLKGVSESSRIMVLTFS
jgi:hypothetical protein